MALFQFFRTRNKEKEPNIVDVFFDMIDRTQATIQFSPNGTILDANANFLACLGYALDEIVGKHHSIFVHPDQVQTESYREFWRDLENGKSFTSQFPRITKNGQQIWIQATYAPCKAANGKVDRVIKVATDITARQNGLNSIAGALEELRQGNLSIRLPMVGLPEIDNLVKTYNQSMEQISGALSSVSQSSNRVDRTAKGLGQAFSALSQRTNQQAATLEQTAAAIEELTSTVRMASEGTVQVEKAANHAIATAKEGGKVAVNAIDAMGKIEQATSRVTQVTSIIDDIAFQTNLLALNAGVEAARAGEAGRGFAVVASEVRQLAASSAQAAAEIKELVRESSSFVKTGVELVKLAAKELQNTIDSIGVIDTQMSEISTGAREQAITLNEINSAVSELDQMTQRNAMMVDESVEAAQALVAQSQDLAREVALFKLNGNGHGIASTFDGRTASHGQSASVRLAS